MPPEGSRRGGAALILALVLGVPCLALLAWRAGYLQRRYCPYWPMLGSHGASEFEPMEFELGNFRGDPTQSGYRSYLD